MYFEDIALHTTVEIAPTVIDKEEMLAFARRYDDIPLHTDEVYAAATPFGQLIAPGLFTFAAVWANYLKVDLFGEELLAGRSTKIEWHKPVFAGDRLTTSAEVTALTPRNPKNGTVEITLKVYNEAGDLVLTDVTEAIVKRRGTVC